MPDIQFDYVIIGGGLAGISAIDSIRTYDPDGSIRLYCKESYLPYHRPPLTKSLWRKPRDINSILVHDREFYDKNQIDVVMRTAVTGIQPEEKTVTDDKGNIVEYNRLLITTGGNPRKLPIDGGDLPDLCYFRTVDDYQHVHSSAQKGSSVLVIGGGFIGSEIAASLIINNVSVTMIYPDQRLCARVFPSSLGHSIQNHFMEKGITIVQEDRPVSIEKKNGKFVTSTQQGRTITTDMIIVGIGITPEVELAHAAGLQTGNGIEVNYFLQTSDRDIFAAGDNTFFPSKTLGRKMRVEHWDNALKQGKCAGKNMTGHMESYTYQPYFFSDLFDFSYEAVGETNAAYEIITDWEKENRQGVIYYVNDDLIEGVMLCNIGRKLDKARAVLGKEKSVVTEHVEEILK